MQGSEVFFKSDILFVDHLNTDSSEELSLINDFHVSIPEGQGLAAYLKHDARNDELAHRMRTYLIKDCDTKECVGYFSLKAGLVSVNESEVDIIDWSSGNSEVIREFDTLPGVEIANFALNSRYIRKYSLKPGMGKIIFSEFIIPIIRKVSEQIGVRMIYIFSLPYERLIRRYEKYGLSLR